MTTKEARLAKGKPLCDICGAKHWPREPHKIRPQPTRRASPQGKSDAARVAGLEGVVIDPEAIDKAMSGLVAGRSFAQVGKAWIPGWRCHCGHEWPCKGDRPRQCPRCKSRTWAKEG